MTITVSKLPAKQSKPAQKKQWKPQRRGKSSAQIDAEIRVRVLHSFDELDYHVSRGGKKFDMSVTFSTRGNGMQDLVFKSENGLSKWQHAKQWLLNVQAYK